MVFAGAAEARAVGQTGGGNYRPSPAVFQTMRLFCWIALMAVSSLASHPALATESLCSHVRLELQVLSRTLDLYRIQYGEYPSNAEGLQRLVSTRCLDATGFNDPWGRPYVYERTPSGFVLLTLGPDGIRGTKDDLEASQIGQGCPTWGRQVPLGDVLIAVSVAVLGVAGLTWGVGRVLRRAKRKHSAAVRGRSDCPPHDGAV
jgi:general secretion pathway protein G